YVIESQQAAIQNSNSSAQQDALILSVIDQLKPQVFWSFIASEFIEFFQLHSFSRPTKGEVPNKNFFNVSMVNTGLKKLKHHLAGFDVVVKERTMATAITECSKLKRKALVDNVVTKYTIDPEMLKIDVEPITPKLLNKKTAHSAYIKHTQEEVAVLRDLVEHVKANYPLDHSLESACRYTKLIKELLTNISKTCPSINNSGETLVVVTLKNKDKRVRFTEPVTSSGNTITKTAFTSNLVSNKPMLSSTGVKPSTSASGSQPSGNIKKDKIQETPSSTQKNKVEAHLRKTFTIVGNVCPLTRITTTAKVPLRKPTALESDTPKHVFFKFENDHMAKILGYGDYHIGNVMISRVYYVEGLRYNLFFVGKFYDSNLEVAFRQHTCFIRNLEGVDLLIGSHGNNLYTLSLGDMMASSPICLLSKASKTKSWLWHRRLSHLNFGAINHLARHGLVPVYFDESNDNGTEFVNQTLREYYEKVGISHETSVARFPQQNGVVERPMQDELNEFERLEVCELVPRLDKVMVIILKWIYKVKLNELGGILKNKARLVARGYRQEEGINFEESYDS
ncbi:integrase, catalytic region, zinc finger, CCHC-type containing protein, partial [Tanacetum coccineum]